MESGEEPTSLCVVRIKREQFLQGSRRPAILAGIHVSDGFL
jgi:hypothetical protein